MTDMSSLDDTIGNRGVSPQGPASAGPFFIRLTAQLRRVVLAAALLLLKAALAETALSRELNLA